MSQQFAGIGGDAATKAALRSVTEVLFGADIGRARSLATKQLVATSGIADLIGSDKMMASWRQSLLSEATARSLVGTKILSASNTDKLRDIVGINTAIARIVGRYAEQNMAFMLAPRSAPGPPASSADTSPACPSPPPAPTSTENRGPAAVSMAAHAAVEVVDRTLRAVAPDEAAREWHAANDCHGDEIYLKGGKAAPTRTLRVAYALHQRRPEEAKLIDALTKALSSNVTLVQGSLHPGAVASCSAGTSDP